MRYLTSISKKQQHRVPKSHMDTGLSAFIRFCAKRCLWFGCYPGWLALLPDEVAPLKVASPDLPTPVCSFGSGEAVVASLLCVGWTPGEPLQPGMGTVCTSCARRADPCLKWIFISDKAVWLGMKLCHSLFLPCQQAASSPGSHCPSPLPKTLLILCVVLKTEKQPNVVFL